MKKFLAILMAMMMMVCMSGVANAISGGVPSLDEVAEMCEDYTDRDVQRVVNESLDCVIVDFTPSNGHYIYLVFEMNGTNGNILAARMYSDTEYYLCPQSSLVEGMSITNQWNYEYRYPIAFIDPTDGQYMANDFLFCVDATEGMVYEFVTNQIFGIEMLLEYFGNEGISLYSDFATE